MVDLILSIINLFQNKGKFNNSITFFILLLNNIFVQCDFNDCISNRTLGNQDCFNNIIKIEGFKYREGRFVTTKKGELIIEYSQDYQSGGHRLFYHLTQDGRGYYENNNPIKEINIQNTEIFENIIGRFEARNILIELDGDTTGKEYLLSTSSWLSLTEIYDLESDNYYTYFTPSFFNMNDKYIFSYNYELLREPETSNYFIIYTQYERPEAGDDYSESYYIRKFVINSLNNNNIPYFEKRVINNPDNENDRIVSASILENKNFLVVLYLKPENNDNSGLYLQGYDYNLYTVSNTDIRIGTILNNYPGGKGLFFKVLSWIMNIWQFYIIQILKVMN